MIKKRVVHNKGKRKDNYEPLKIVSEKLTGIKRSNTTKNKIRLSRLGKKHSLETIKKISLFRKGYKHTEETKRKIRESSKGKHAYLKNITREQRSHFGEKNGMYGKTHNKEAIKKIKEKRLQQIIPKYDTKIEKLIQQKLKNRKINFQTHKIIDNIYHKYRCDVFIHSNIVIECDGDYWHNYPIGNKLDHIRTREMIDKGYTVIRFWEHEINKNPEWCIDFIQNMMNKGDNK